MVFFKDGVLLLLVYCLAALVILGVCTAGFKNVKKASLVTGYLLAFHFFFGALHDWLKAIAPDFFLVKYTFLIPCFLITLLVLIILVKRVKTVDRAIYFINLVLIVSILTDLVPLVLKPGSKSNGTEAIYVNKELADYLKKYKVDNHAGKPDIFITILDEYAGKEQLLQGFGYDNSFFLNALNDKGFQVSDGSLANYNATMYSTASIFSCQFIDTALVDNSKRGFKQAIKIINDNPVLSLLENNGYRVFNQSIFQVKDQASPNIGGLVPARTAVITQATFVSRIQKDLFLNFATRFNVEGYLKKEKYATAINNEAALGKTLALAKRAETGPKVVYTHLLMPHYPYFKDSLGHDIPFPKLNEQSFTDTAAYLSYLKYTNKVVLDYVDTLQAHTNREAIIIVLSDHGNRYLKGDSEKLLYSNLLSLYLPEKLYFPVPDSLSNVNLFPLLFNHMFKTALPSQPDNMYKFAY